MLLSILTIPCLWRGLCVCLGVSRWMCWSVRKAVVDERPKDFQDCVRWGRMLWESNFNNQIQQLLFNFPPDQVTSSGAPFWSGPKRCPRPLVWGDALSKEFVLCG